MPTGISQVARRIITSPMNERAQLAMQEWFKREALAQIPAQSSFSEEFMDFLGAVLLEES